MYFLEQGNVDDDATFIAIFLVSFNLQSCCLMQSAVCSLRSAVCSLQSAVCSLQMSYTDNLACSSHRFPCFFDSDEILLKGSWLENKGF